MSSFSFTVTATTEIYTLSLHDALPIFGILPIRLILRPENGSRRLSLTNMKKQWNWKKPLPNKIDIGTDLCYTETLPGIPAGFFWRFLCDYRDRKSTRLNSSHVSISYAVFCLKKKIQLFILYKCLLTTH